MPINKFLYFGDFVVIPLTTLLFMYLAYRAFGMMAAPEFFTALIFGAAIWTLIEYLVHRYVYHHLPILSPMHGEHHKRPDEFIGVPSFLSSGLIVAVCYFPLSYWSPTAAGGFASGMLLGYAAYMYVHHAVHHFEIEPGDWLYRAKIRHLSHHYRDAANFGVSTGFWDRVFGTERMPRRVATRG